MVKEISQKLRAGPESGLAAIHLYSAIDPIPVPDASESDSDAAWALWDEAFSSKKSGVGADFKSTESAEISPFLFFDSLKRNR